MIHKLNVTQIDWFSYFVMHLLFFLIKLSVTESHFLYSVLSDDPTFPNLFGIDDNVFLVLAHFATSDIGGQISPKVYIVI